MEPRWFVSFIMQFCRPRKGIDRCFTREIGDIVHVMRGFLQKQTSRLLRVTIPAMIIHAAIGDVVDRLHHGQFAKKPALDNALHLPHKRRDPQRERDHRAIGLTLRCGFQAGILLFVDADGFFQIERNAAGKHLCGKSRVKGAARADENAVQPALLEQRIGAFYKYGLRKACVVRRLRTDLLRARVGDGKHANVCLNCGKRLHHRAGAETVSNKSDIFCHAVVSTFFGIK
ncbi:hypothetical protein SDC9_131995 [bioreactor metagenome]|uniref:Uncharacterized protein n=1 Tax=bioreactor metagenome TaxID=1076179 RepID=A0A645D6S4_9ZZZZ